MQTSSPLEYNCHGYHEKLPKGKASGTLKIAASSLIVTIQGQRINLPYQGCELELGGASDRIVFIRHPLAQDWTFYTSDRRLLQDPRLSRVPSAVLQRKRLRQKRTKHALIIITALGFLVGLPSLLIFNMNKISAVVARRVPLEWEEKLGQSTIRQYSLSHKMLDSPTSDALLKPLVEPLLAQLKQRIHPYKYRFHIVQDANLNAFALPGGFVVIHSQLILEADNAEQLLGVLAHEMIHVERQHGIRNVIAAAGIYTVISAVFGDTSGIFAALTGAAPFLLKQSYSRQFETEADKLGVALLQDARIRPEGLANFFKKMVEKEKQMLENISNENARQSIEQVMRILSTHPASAERIANLMALTSQHFANHLDFDPQFYHLQQHVRQLLSQDTQAVNATRKPLREAN